MFIRFDFSNFSNGRIIKFASIGLAVIMAVSFLARIWEYSTDEGLVKTVLEDTAVSLYRHVVSNEYNIDVYDSDKDKEETDISVINQIVDVINQNNSFYKYMESKEVVMSFAGDDPLYNYRDVVVKDIEGGIEQQSDSTEVVDNKDEATIQTDGQTEKEPDYTAPAVADTGIKYTIEQLSDYDFLMSKLYTVPARALVYESDLVAEDMLAKDMTIQGDNSKPQILIYHTHSQEGFVDSVQGDDNTNIVAVGAYLAKILSEEYGYNVIHCREHFDIAGGSLDRSKAYTYAQYTIEQILEDNPSIDVILDIHRDGLPENADKLVTNIDGKDTAKIMFFNGVSRSSAAGDIDYLYNRYRSDNLAFSFQLKLMAMECYPEITRRNYIDAYQYNLQHRQKSVLVEVGAQNNTLQEELNAMEVLAEVLHRVIAPDKEE